MHTNTELPLVLEPCLVIRNEYGTSWYLPNRRYPSFIFVSD